MTDVHQLLTEYIDAYNAGRLDDVRAMVAPGYVHHSGGEDLTIDDFCAGAGFLRRGLPDFRIVVDDRFAVADRAAVRFHGIGTHAGSFRGEAPSGSTVLLRGITIFRVDAGLVAEDWEALDEAPLMALLTRA